MIVFKILGITLAIILALIIILLLLPAGFSFVSGTQKSTSFKVTLAGFTVFNSAKNSKKGKSDKKDGKTDLAALTKKSGGAIELAEKVFNIISVVLSRLKWLLPYLKLKKLNVNFVCASDDAAACGIKYGAACAIVYPISALLESGVKSSKNAQNINITCDFTKENDVFDIYLSLKITTLFLFLAAVLALKDYIKKQI